MWLQLNCRDSDTTISSSEKTWENWIMRYRFALVKPRPNFRVNCGSSEAIISLA